MKTLDRLPVSAEDLAGVATLLRGLFTEVEREIFALEDDDQWVSARESQHAC